MFKSMCYIPDDLNDAMGRVEMAFKANLAANLVKKKIYKAIKAHKLPKAPLASVAEKAVELGVISAAELNQLQYALKLADEVIQVDEFAPFALGRKNAHPSWN